MALKVGDTIPNFTAKDTNGNDFEANPLLGNNRLSFIFIPKTKPKFVPSKPVVLEIIIKNSKI